ncbi:MAG: ATP-binding protein [Candidatus Sumerlaeia bacterium]|nr:ATP-binding protein [Candidatus Sumerlaeia bacterium]
MMPSAFSDVDSSMTEKNREGNIEFAFLGCLLLERDAAGSPAIARALRELAHHARGDEAAIFSLYGGRLERKFSSNKSPGAFQVGNLPTEVVDSLANGEDQIFPGSNACDLGPALLLPLQPAMGSEVLGIFCRPGAPPWSPQQIDLLRIASTVLAHALVRVTQASPAGSDPSVYTLEVILPNSLGLVPAVTDFLVDHATASLTDGDGGVGLKLGLVELVNNAIEHGNLGITSQEKEKALETPGAYDALIRSRMDEQHRAMRLVRIRMTCSPSAVEWTVEDEGGGFDAKAALKQYSTDMPNLMNLSGRGIFLCWNYFDELEYLGKGNRVRAVKHITH